MLDSLTPEVTYGDALTILLVVVAAIGSGVLALCRKYRSATRLGLFYRDHLNRRARNKAAMKPVGKHEIAILLIPRESIRFQEISVRCVDRSFLTWGLQRMDAPQDVIEIIGFRDLRLERGGNRAIDELGIAHRDGLGGVDVSYSREHHWPATKPMEFILTIDAKKPWSGELSICIERGEDRRPYARARLTVTHPDQRVSETAPHCSQ